MIKQRHGPGLWSVTQSRFLEIRCPLHLLGQEWGQQGNLQVANSQGAREVVPHSVFNSDCETHPHRMLSMLRNTGSERNRKNEWK